MVSQEHVEIVRRLADQFSRTLELPEEVFATNWVLDLTHATRVPDHSPYYEGMAGWRDFYGIWIEQFDGMSYEWQSIHDVGDRVAVVGRQRAIAKMSRVPVEQTIGLIYTFHDGLITRVEMFNGAADEALKAVGLSE